MALERIELQGPSGYVPYPAAFVLRDRTGQPAVGAELLALDGMLPLQATQGTLSDAWLHASLVEALLGGGERRRSVTSYRNPLTIELPTRFSVAAIDNDSPSTVLLVVAAPVRSASAPAQKRLRPEPRSHSAITPAEELRSISGLPPAMLADLFDVSRTAYYKWMEGATPRDERFQHLVEVLAHVKDARQRLPASVEFTSWLRTPISPGAKAPLEYLRASRFNVFRGLVLRASAAGIASAPLASVVPGRAMSASERAAARERISPLPRFEEDED